MSEKEIIVSEKEKIKRDFNLNIQLKTIEKVILKHQETLKRLADK